MNLPRHIRRAAKLASGTLLAPLRPGNIAMFHAGRSGSSVLGGLLNQHAGMLWDREVFKPGRIEALCGNGPAKGLAQRPLAVLRLLMSRAGKRYYGFETQLTQLERLGFELPEYVERLVRMKFDHFVVLERKNTLRRIASVLVGRSASRWHLTQGDREPELARIRFETESLNLRGEPKPLIEYLRESRDTFELLDECLRGRSVLRLTYEKDIAEDPAQAYRRVCEFLGLQPAQVSVRLRKTNPFSLREMVTNFEDLERALGGTEFAWMLND